MVDAWERGLELLDSGRDCQSRGDAPGHCVLGAERSPRHQGGTATGFGRGRGADLVPGTKPWLPSGAAELTGAAPRPEPAAEEQDPALGVLEKRAAQVCHRLLQPAELLGARPPARARGQGDAGRRLLCPCSASPWLESQVSGYQDPLLGYHDRFSGYWDPFR